jgi:hypothetical protein
VNQSSGVRNYVSIERGELIMPRRTSQLVFVSVVMVSLSHVTAAEKGHAHWIWPTDTRPSVTAASFSKSFVIDKKIRTAELFAAAEYSHLRIHVNETLVSEIEPYDNPIFLDVTTFLKRGRNVIRLTAEPIDGPAAIACGLKAHFNGHHLDVRTPKLFLSEKLPRPLGSCRSETTRSTPSTITRNGNAHSTPPAVRTQRPFKCLTDSRFSWSILPRPTKVLGLAWLSTHLVA